MANRNEGAINEGTDSRTATFERKRPFDLTTHDDSSNAGSAASTPRKRRKRRGKGGDQRAYQDVRDFVPDGVNFSRTPGDLPSGIEGNEDHGDVKTGEDVARAPENSNGPIKSQQGQSQEGNAIKEDATEDEAAMKNENSFEDDSNSADEGFLQEIQDVREKPDTNATSKNWNTGSSVSIRTKLGAIATWPNLKDVEGLPDYLEMAEKRKKALLTAHGQLTKLRTNRNPRGDIHEAEVDYYYCLYYPTNEKWRNPPRTGTRTPHRRIPTRTLEWRISFWELVKECIEQGTLQELKDGKVKVDDSPSDPEQLRTIGEPNLDKLPQDYQDQVAIGPPDISAQSLPPSDPRLIGASEAIAQAQDVYIAERSPARTPERPLKHETLSEGGLEDSESDENVLLNLEPVHDIKTSPLSSQDKSTTKEELKEVWNDSDDNEDSEDFLETSDSEMDDDGRSGNGDAMMDYSKSEPTNSEQVRLQQDRDGVNTERNARILHDLGPRELNAQLRYFYPTQKPANVSQETPVRCLVCAEEGHMAAACNALTCSTCGSYNQHTTGACPQTTKCSKCRETGHDQPQCPYKLKNITKSEIICDLCQRNGHAEADCELQWRTSGQLWEPNVVGRRVHLSCYECGRAGHLGNDCPTRRPSKTFGYSTWGSGHTQASIKSKGQLNIKGRATQQEPIILDDSEDELANFHRPKLPLPARKGQIKVNVPDSRPWGGDYNDSYRHSSGYRDYRDDDGGQESWRSEDKYTSYHRRRSVSPQYRDYGRDYRSDRYQPGPQSNYQNQRPPTNTNVYRPMPSSAQNAWSRHRM